MQPDLAVIIGVHAGRMYYNLSAIHRVLRAVPFGEYLVAWFNEFTGAPSGDHGAQRRPAGLVGGLRGALELGWIGCMATWQYLFIERRVAAFERRIDEFPAAYGVGMLAKQTDLQLRDALHIPRYPPQSLDDACRCGAMVCYGLLKTVVTHTFPGADGAQLHNSLLKGLSGLKSAQPIGELWALAQAVQRDDVLRAMLTELPGERIAERLVSDERFAGFNAQSSLLERWGFAVRRAHATVPSFQERLENC
jgi:hypothetical protein